MQCFSSPPVVAKISYGTRKSFWSDAATSFLLYSPWFNLDNWQPGHRALQNPYITPQPQNRYVQNKEQTHSKPANLLQLLWATDSSQLQLCSQQVRQILWQDVLSVSDTRSSQTLCEWIKVTPDCDSWGALQHSRGWRDDGGFHNHRTAYFAFTFMYLLRHYAEEWTQ